MHTVVVSGSEDKTIRRWDARTGEAIGAPLIYTHSVSSVAFGAIDSRPVVVSVGIGGAIRRWDARTGEAIGAPLEEICLDSVAFGAIDGRPVVASGASIFGSVIIRLWDARTGEAIGGPLIWHTVAFGAIDGRPVVASRSNNDGTIRLWNGRTLAPIGAPLEGHTERVTSVAFGMVDGAPVIVSGSQDQTIRLWDARIGESGHSWAIMIGEPVETICTDDGAKVVVMLARGQFGEIHGGNRDRLRHPCHR